MSQKTLNVITPTGNRSITVDSSTTVAQLRTELGLDAGMKASAGGVGLDDNTTMETYSRVSFAGGTKSNADPQEVKAVLLVSEDLEIAQVHTNAFDFGSEAVVKARSKLNGAFAEPVIVPPNVTVKPGDVVIIGNPARVGVVGSVGNITVSAANACPSYGYPTVVGVVDSSGADKAKRGWDSCFEDALSVAGDRIEEARRVEAVKSLSEELSVDTLSDAAVSCDGGKTAS